MPLLTIRAAFAIDTEAALGPQLVAARAEAEPVSWKLLAAATGRSVRCLQMLHEAQIADWRAAGCGRRLRVDAQDKAAAARR